jgi:PAS domain S-box-containing protein
MTPQNIQKRRIETFRIVAIYSLFGLLWIFCSDIVLGWRVHDPAMIVKIAVLKGSLFILFTAILLFFLVNRLIRQLTSVEASQLEILQNYAAIFNATSEAIFIHDIKSGRILDINDRVLEIYGYTRDEALSVRIGELSEGTPPYSQVEAEEKVSKALLEGPQIFEWHSRKKNGELFWSEVSLRFITIHGSDRIIAVVRDISERKRAEYELSQSADIIRNMQVGLYVFRLGNSEDDHTLQMVAANPMSASLLGLTEADIVGRPIDEIFPNLRKAGIPEKFAHVVRTGQAIEVEDFFYGDQNVHDSFFDFKAFPLPDNCVGVLFEDITLRQHAEAALQNMNKELEARVDQRTAELKTLNSELHAFNYSISYDMRAPLTRIKWYANTLMDICAAKLSKEELQYLSRLRAASHRLDEHIEALLKLYQIDHGDFYIEPVNLSELALTIVHDLQSFESDRKVTFTVADGMILNADKMLMKAFLDNLLSNAWKYTAGKEDAKIEFGITTRDGKDVYFVKDNGIGFNMDQADNIFTPFLRLHKEDNGLGIGLASMQRIIRLHGGRIWAESKDGEGATFYFTLH